MRMFLGFLERIGFFRFLQDHVLFITVWGSTVMIVVIVLGAAGIWLLGRNSRWLIPKTGLGRLSSILLLFVVILSSWGLILVKGAMSPLSRAVLQMDQAVGKKVPNLSFRLVSDGSQHQLGEFEGKVILLNLWATWCPPCRSEMPTLSRLHSSYSERGLVVVTLSDEPREDLLAFIQENSLQTVNGYFESFDWFPIEQMRPFTLLIDRRGVLRKFLAGAKEYEVFEANLRQYL